MTQDQIHQKLLSLGAKENDFAKIIRDVNGVIFRRLSEKRLKSLPETVLENPPQTTQAWKEVFVKNDIPPFNEKEIEEAVEKTWDEYFTFMEKNTG